MTVDWRITCWYLLILAAAVVPAKITSIRAAGIRRPSAMLAHGFFWAPSLCYPSWLKRGWLASTGRRRLVLTSLLPVALMVMLYRSLIPEMGRFPWWLQSYLAVVPFWLLIEAGSGLCRLLWLGSGRLVPPINNKPWRAVSLADFWGRRWNRLIGDWLRQMVFMRLRRKPRLALFATFLVSGILHELLVSLPYALVYGGSVWGWLTGYFLLQYPAVLLERRLHPGSVFRRLLLWLAVLGPVPLVLNPATLLIFHLGG